MRRQTLMTAAAFACMSLLAACGQKTADQTNTTVATVENQTGQAVSATQDEAAKAVGVGSATIGSVTKDAFVSDAAMSDMYEIEAAKLALAHSKNMDVRDFARMMIKAHTASTAKLKALIASGKVQATPPTKLDDRRMGLLDNLRAAADADFDARYLDQQVAAHREAKLLMAGYKAVGSDPALKAFAADVAPVVQMHLDKLDQIRADKKAAAEATSNTTGKP